MNTMERSLLIATVLLAGCGTTRNVAVTSYHVTRDVAVGSYRVATAPVHYALKGRGEPKMVGTQRQRHRMSPSPVNPFRRRRSRRRPGATRSTRRKAVKARQE